MSDTELISVLKSIDVRLGGVETRLGGVETRLGGVETRLGGMETRLDGLEAHYRELSDSHRELKDYVKGQPDFRLLGHQMAALMDRVNEIHASHIRAVAAITDIARENVTPGEVEALHTELKEIRTTEFNLDVRMRRIEDELHLQP